MWIDANIVVLDVIAFILVALFALRIVEWWQTSDGAMK